MSGEGVEGLRCQPKAFALRTHQLAPLKVAPLAAQRTDARTPSLLSAQQAKRADRRWQREGAKPPHMIPRMYLLVAGAQRLEGCRS